VEQRAQPRRVPPAVAAVVAGLVAWRFLGARRALGVARIASRLASGGV
jgi:hypothetical protein